MKKELEAPHAKVETDEPKEIRSGYIHVDEQTMGQQIKEQVHSDTPEISAEDAIKQYLDDPNTKINAIYWADKFNEKFRGNWFTVDQVQKKTQFKKKDEALGVLQVMCLIGVCIVDGGKSKYKITLDLDQRIQLMKKELERVTSDKQKAIVQVTMQYDLKIASLENEIKRMEVVPEEKAS